MLRRAPAGALLAGAVWFLAGCHPGVAARTPVADVMLADRAADCLAEARTHLLPEGLLVYRMDWPDTEAKRYRRARRQADGAYFQGLYVGALAQRAALTGEAADREEALAAWRALHRLMTGSAYDGLVARTFGKRAEEGAALEFRDDCSGDQITGFVWGQYWALKLLDAEEVAEGAAADLKALVAHLERHDLKVHRRPDEPTRFGDYRVDVAGMVPIGHRAVGALAVALVALLACPDEPAVAAFLDRLLAAGYPAKVRWFYPWFPHSSANTINYLLNLYLVWELDADPGRRAFYEGGREEAWELTRLWQMPFYAALVRAMGGARDLELVDDTLRRLRNLPHRHTWHEDEEVRWRLQVVPLERRPSSTSHWSQSPRLELVGRGEEAPVRIARVDFLSAYWFGRVHRFYGAGE